MEYQDIFAWSYKDLKGIPPSIFQHTIPLLSNTIHVRQKYRRLNPMMQIIMKIEFKRLLQARFIKPIEITDWLSYIVLMKKKGGNKLRVCMDYRDLNKYIQKDHFSLPFITFVVDDVTDHDIQSFMDDYSSYNQVSIALEDWHKSAFLSP